MSSPTTNDSEALALAALAATLTDERRAQRFLDLIRLIRKDAKLARVPIMAVTAYSAQGDEERIRAAGAQAYVAKPISVMKFAQTVEELLTADAAARPRAPAESAPEHNGG